MNDTLDPRQSDRAGLDKLSLRGVCGSDVKVWRCGGTGRDNLEMEMQKFQENCRLTKFGKGCPFPIKEGTTGLQVVEQLHGQSEASKT